MELIHADELLIEQRPIDSLDKWDIVVSLSDKSTDNDFQLIIPEDEWLIVPIEIGHYLYEPGTEFGGRVTGIKHINKQIEVTGRTWRGMLIDKIVQPPGGSAYKTITSVEANTAIADLLGTSFGPLVVASAAASGITVSGEFRYQTLLYCLHRMLNDADARLKIEFEDGVVTLSAVAITDLSADDEFSQDFSANIRSSMDNSKAYNHVIALGSGELTARTVVELYRQADGTINSTPLTTDMDDRQIVLDYPNAESTDELTKKATDLLNEDYWPVESVEADVPEDQSLNLGDIVGGRDYITGLAISAQVIQIIRTVNRDGVSVQYKVG